MAQPKEKLKRDRYRHRCQTFGFENHRDLQSFKILQ